MTEKTIDEIVAKGIRRTINRFREKPFFYFSESDLHASLLKDITENNSDELYLDLYNRKKALSMVHLEYPTNFEYSRKSEHCNPDETTQDYRIRRGNFDLVVLNPELFKQTTEANKRNLISVIKGIIAKDSKSQKGILDEAQTLIDYAIEVKFIHFSNTCSEIFEQVRIDNSKLNKSVENNKNIKAINLIFCYYWTDDKKNDKWTNKLQNLRINLRQGFLDDGVIDNESVEIPKGVLNVLIEASVKQKTTIEDQSISLVKTTNKPQFYYQDIDGLNEPTWVTNIKEGIKEVKGSF